MLQEYTNKLASRRIECGAIGIPYFIRDNNFEISFFLRGRFVVGGFLFENYEIIVVLARKRYFSKLFIYLILLYFFSNFKFLNYWC